MNAGAEPVSNDSKTKDVHNAYNAVIGSDTVRTAGWESHECGLVGAALYLGITRQSAATSLRTVTIARDMTLDELEAATQKQEAAQQATREKVKF